MFVASCWNIHSFSINKIVEDVLEVMGKVEQQKQTFPISGWMHNARLDCTSTEKSKKFPA